MYPRTTNDTDDAAPLPPLLVRAEVVIRHAATAPLSSISEVPRAVSSTISDASGLRMTYHWSSPRETTDQQPTSTTTTIPAGAFGFQRGNILFTSTPPVRPVPFRASTIPRASSKQPPVNFSDSGYTSEQLSSQQSYSSLPCRGKPLLPGQQQQAVNNNNNNKRCRSTCSIVLSTCRSGDIKQDENHNVAAASSSATCQPCCCHHLSTTTTRCHFSTLPEVCEECNDSGGHFCHQQHPINVANKATGISRDVASQTTDIERQDSRSTVSRGGNRARRRNTTSLVEMQKKRNLRSSISSPEDKQQQQDSSSTSDKKKSRTVHIDVYCTGTDEDNLNESTAGDTQSEDERSTPKTVFENDSVAVTHTKAPQGFLPRGFTDDKAFLRNKASESFRHPVMKMPSLASSKGYESDDVLSSLYPSQFSSYSRIRDFDWSAASSSTNVPHDGYDYSPSATSWKDTLSNIASLANSGPSLTSCDSFEYADSLDRARIRKLTREKQLEPERSSVQSEKLKEYLDKHPVIGWSSDESDDSDGVGWSFVSSNQLGLTSAKTPDVVDSSQNRIVDKPWSPCKTQVAAKTPDLDKSENKIIERELSEILQLSEDNNSRSEASTTRPSRSIFRDRIGPFGSQSPSPYPSRTVSGVTSPFTTSQGIKTDHIVKASRFGAVVNAFRKPGHHIGPSKNPSCTCEHCKQYFEDVTRSRSRSLSVARGRTPSEHDNIIRPVPRRLN